MVVCGAGHLTVFVKIDGLHVLGSPAVLHLTSGQPDITKTEVLAGSLRKAIAGKKATVKIRCKDVSGNPSVPASHWKLGLTLVPASEAAIPDVWRRVDAFPIERNLIGDQLEFVFVPKIAGDLSAFMWSSIEEGKAKTTSGKGRKTVRAVSDKSAGKSAGTGSPTKAKTKRKVKRRERRRRASTTGSCCPARPSR